MKVNRFILITIIIIFSVIMSGCWNYREINNMVIVSGVAIDRDMENKKYKIAVEIVKLEESSIKPEILQCEGDTIFEAVRDLIKKSSKKLYWSHAKVVIFSESLAKEGIAPVLDWMGRDAEVRSDMYIFISREKTAEEILKFTPITENLVSYEIASTMQTRKSSEEYREEDIWHMLNDLAQKGVSDIVPVIKKSKLGEKETFVINGSGVFKKDKLVGWLNGEETKDVLYVRDEIKDGLLTINNVEGTKNNVTFEVSSNKTKINVEYKNNKVIFNIDIKTMVNIAEINGDKDFIDEKNRKKLKEYSESVLERRIKSTVEKVQNEFGSDIFKFGNLVERKKPETWKKISDDWEKEFKAAEVKINVGLDIIGSAAAVKPIKVEE